MISDPVRNKVRRHTMRRAFYPLGEIIHLITLYLGVAVLVAGILALAVPPLRSQAQQVHVLLRAALKPEGYRVPFHYAQSGAQPQDTEGLAWVSSVMSSEELPWPQMTSESGDVGEEPIEPLPHLSFVRALVDSEEQADIPGVTVKQAEALRSYIARKYRVAGNVAGALIRTVFTVGRNMDLEPQLLLAVIAIESRYNPFAESHMGAQGLMQVMTRVHKDKFAALGEGPLAALHPLVNIQVGAQILSDCIARRGSLDGGLACYVGATGPSDGGYGAKVKAERRRIALASGIPVEP